MNLKNFLKGEITQQELLDYYNATITKKRMPRGINGLVLQYRGIYSIFINASLPYSKRKRVLFHELAHIELNQLDQIDNLLALSRDDYEDEADRYFKEILAQTKKEMKPVEKHSSQS